MPKPLGLISENVFKSQLDGITCAIKTISSDTSNDEKARLLQEATYLGSCEHNHIVKMLKFDPSLPSISLEYIPKTVSTYLHESFLATQTWHNEHKILQGVIKGLRYLHDKKIIHCDIKGSNVLIDDSFTAKICDFGIAKTISDDKFTTQISQTSFTPRWCARETLFDMQASRSSDIYSFGMLALEIIQKRPPWFRSDWPSYISEMNLKHLPTIPKFSPKFFRSVVEKCYSHTLSRRIQAHKLEKFIDNHESDMSKAKPVTRFERDLNGL